MSITQGLFSDVLANAPGGGSADWSKTLPMAGAVDWTKVNPFQVINPLTGYNYGATQPTQPTQAAQPEQPQLSEYQKWLAQQSKPAQYESGGGRDVVGGMGYTQESPLAGPSQTGTFLGDLTLVANTGLLGLPGRLASQIAMPYVTNYVAQQAQKDLASQIAADPSFGGGGYTGPGGTTSPTGAGIAANPMGIDPATAQGQGGGGVSSGGGYDGGSYAGGDFGYSGPDRGDYF